MLQLTKASRCRLKEVGPVEVTSSKTTQPKLFWMLLPSLPRSFEQGVPEFNEILCRCGDHLRHLSGPGWRGPSRFRFRLASRYRRDRQGRSSHSPESILQDRKAHLSATC